MDRFGTPRPSIGEESTGTQSRQRNVSDGSQSTVRSTWSAESPPPGPRVWREQQGQKAQRFRGVNVTEAQQYWTAYPNIASPTVSNHAQAHADPTTENSQTNNHVRIDSAIEATGLPKSDCSVLTYIPYHLDNLKRQAQSLAESYRNFGLLFHSFTQQVIFHGAIDPMITGFARRNFHIANRAPLPGIIHIIGTLQNTLRTAESILRETQSKELSKVASDRVRAQLRLTERLIAEGVQQLHLLRQAVEVFCRVRLILWMEGHHLQEFSGKRRRRCRAYQAWAHALPLICWEGFRGDEIERLEVASEVALES